MPAPALPSLRPARSSHGEKTTLLTRPHTKLHFTRAQSTGPRPWPVPDFRFDSSRQEMARERRKMLSEGLMVGWDRGTVIPVLIQAMGGLCVGQVTKYAGGVKKGFAVVSGILLTTVLQVKRRPLPSLACCPANVLIPRSGGLGSLSAAGADCVPPRAAGGDVWCWNPVDDVPCHAAGHHQRCGALYVPPEKGRRQGQRRLRFMPREFPQHSPGLGA